LSSAFLLPLSSLILRSFCSSPLRSPSRPLRNSSGFLAAVLSFFFFLSDLDASSLLSDFHPLNAFFSVFSGMRVFFLAHLCLRSFFLFSRAPATSSLLAARSNASLFSLDGICSARDDLVLLLYSSRDMWPFDFVFASQCFHVPTPFLVTPCDASPFFRLDFFCAEKFGGLAFFT